MSTICLAQCLVYELSIYGNYFYHPTCNFIKIMALVVQDISLEVTLIKLIITPFLHIMLSSIPSYSKSTKHSIYTHTHTHNLQERSIF